MKLYVVTFKEPLGPPYEEAVRYITEPYMADDFDHAEEQCRNANSANIDIVNISRIPFYMIERAYIIEKPKGGE